MLKPSSAPTYSAFKNVCPAAPIWSFLAQAWHSHGTGMAQAWHRHGTVMAHSWHKHGTGIAQAWHRQIILKMYKNDQIVVLEHKFLNALYKTSNSNEEINATIF